MKLALSWLYELLPDLGALLLDRDASSPVEALEPILANLGLPVDDVTTLPAPPDGVVYGEVIDCAPIEGTGLYRLTVEAGEPAPVTIVTGAPNARSGVGVAVATPGSTIAGASIGVRAVQGVASWGMVCSPKELDIGEYAAGLLLLPARTATPGTPLADLWPADEMIDVEVTPNRADALSVLGIARDLAAALDLRLAPPSAGLLPEPGASGPVTIGLTDGCDRFVGRAASGVRNGPSPVEVQRRLLASGLRPIDLIVDASNYVMLELGQPTALYDARDVGGALRADQARAGETVVTLSGDEKTLAASDLVIRNAEGEILGVAGVSGARHGEIRADTTDVVLEAAHFDPVRLRLTARRLDLKTDAVYRYERGVDPNLPAWAANRIMELLARHGGAQVHPGLTDEGGEQRRSPLTFRPADARALLGLALADEEMRRSLERLGCVVETNGEVWQVTPPTWRVDLNIHEDLTEEVIRLHGYGELPETLPTFRVHESNLGVGEESRARRDLRAAFALRGFQEVVTYTFTSDEEADRARAARPHLRLRNPLTSERTGMRTALYPSLLRTALSNSADSLLLFEVGRVFPESGEVERVGALMRGPLTSDTWQPGLAGGFFAFKGLLEAAAGTLGAAFDLRQLRGEEVPAALHPGIAAEVRWNGGAVGWLGALHPAVAADVGLKGETYLLEIGFPLPGRPWTFHDPLRTPANLRDLAVIAPRDVTYGELRDLLRREGGELLERVDVFDVYEGASIPAGQRSVAVRLTYRGARTLTDADVDPAFARAIDAVRGAGWTVRER